MPDEQRKLIFSKNFNEAMQNKGIRQIDIVKDLKINSSTVSNWSKGVMLPRSDKLKLLSNYLGVSAATLMGWDEEYEFKDTIPNTLAAHFEGEEFTAEEIKKIKEYAELLKAARPALDKFVEYATTGLDDLLVPDKEETE